MDGSPLLFALPTLRSGRSSVPATTRRVTRKQPIRDNIMTFLTEARSAKQVAGQIDRKVSIATGHLRAMRVRGLVVRVGWGQYVRADCCSEPPDPATITRANSTRDLVRLHAPEAESLEHLQTLTGRSAVRVLHAAQRLREMGHAVPEKATVPAQG